MYSMTNSCHFPIKIGKKNVKFFMTSSFLFENIKQQSFAPRGHFLLDTKNQEAKLHLKDCAL